MYPLGESRHGFPDGHHDNRHGDVAACQTRRAASCKESRMGKPQKPRTDSSGAVMLAVLMVLSSRLDAPYAFVCCLLTIGSIIWRSTIR